MEKRQIHLKKYVLEAPTDNKENADKDEAKQNESNEVGN